MVEQEFAVLKETLSALRFRKLWPAKGKTNRPGRLYYFSLAVALVFYSGAVITIILHLYKVLKDNIDVDVNEDISLISSMIGLYYIFLLYVNKQKDAAQLYQHLSNFERFGKPDDFDKGNAKLNFYSKLFSYYVNFAMAAYGALAYLDGSKCDRMNGQRDFEENCGLYVPAWLPYVNLNYFPVKQLFFMYQFFCGCMIVTGGAMVSFSAFETACHIIIRIKHLKRLLTECFDGPTHKQKREQLNFCITYHIDIIAILDMFNSSYKNAMGVHIFMTSIIFGCIANQIAQDNSIAAVFHLIGWVMALYIVCGCGQILITETESIADAAYNSKWYEAEIDLQKDLVMIIKRSQIPFNMYAGPFAVLSLPLFVSIMKTSYSYFTLLNQSL